MMVFLSPQALSITPSVEKTINYLLVFVRESNCTFIRNDEDHDSSYAAEHIKKKYDYFKDRIDTPEEFIELCATKSLMSGKVYLVRCEGDRTIPTAEWLRAELNNYRSKRSQASSASK